MLVPSLAVTSISLRFFGLLSITLLSDNVFVAVERLSNSQLDFAIFSKPPKFGWYVLTRTSGKSTGGVTWVLGSSRVSLSLRAAFA